MTKRIRRISTVLRLNTPYAPSFHLLISDTAVHYGVVGVAFLYFWPQVIPEATKIARRKLGLVSRAGAEEKAGRGCHDQYHALNRLFSSLESSSVSLFHPQAREGSPAQAHSLAILRRKSQDTEPTFFSKKSSTTWDGGSEIVECQNTGVGGREKGSGALVVSSKAGKDLSSTLILLCLLLQKIQRFYSPASSPVVVAVAVAIKKSRKGVFQLSDKKTPARNCQKHQHPASTIKKEALLYEGFSFHSKERRVPSIHGTRLGSSGAGWHYHYHYQQLQICLKNPSAKIGIQADACSIVCSRRQCFGLLKFRVGGRQRFVGAIWHNRPYSENDRLSGFQIRNETIGIALASNYLFDSDDQQAEFFGLQSGGPLSRTIDQRNPVAQLIHLSGLCPILENAVGCPLRTDERLALIHPLTSLVKRGYKLTGLNFSDRRNLFYRPPVFPFYPFVCLSYPVG
ncbi:hypothetical protein KQX54_018359 [Cotesia glomerata]|uniref:Uncharacterized protein n=1 Tax=Cotesia glomerata TaxID=32391 RepID=A0AAV7I985_COTGL|nr:hypothetical protein KQX54_018359 [Cotesia glomerata]